MSASKTRYSAAHLFYAVTLCASATALFEFWGLPITAFVILVWWQVFSGAEREAKLAEKRAHALVTTPVVIPQASMNRRRTQHGHPILQAGANREGASKLELAVVLVITTILLGLLLPATSDSDPLRHAEISMQMVAKALASYEQKHGQYPPAVVYDGQGKPMHSWRALILDELGEEKLAMAYRMDEPWDSPANLTLAGYRPWDYRTYYEETSKPPVTSLHLVTVGSTPIVVEQEAAVCNWLEPVELSHDDWNSGNLLPDLDHGFWQRGFFTSRYRGRLAVSPTSTVHLHPGGVLSPEDFQAGAPTEVSLGERHTHYHFQNALRLGVFLLVALYPIRWLGSRRRPEPS